MHSTILKRHRAPLIGFVLMKNIIILNEDRSAGKMKNQRSVILSSANSGVKMPFQKIAFELRIRSSKNLNQRRPDFSSKFHTHKYMK